MLASCRAAAVVLALLVVTAACGSSGRDDRATDTSVPADRTTIPTTTAAPSDDPEEAPARPEPGTCRPLTPTGTEASVACTEPHGSEVVAVIELPEAVAERVTPELIDVGDEALTAALGDAPAGCDGPLQGALDRVTLLADAPPLFLQAVQGSALRGSTVLPTPEAWTAGARWLACELTAVDPAGESISFAGPLAELGGTAVVPAELAACVDPSGELIVACDGAAPRLVVQGSVDRSTDLDQGAADTACADALRSLGVAQPDAVGLIANVRSQDEDTVVVDCLVPSDADLRSDGGR